MQAEHDLVTAGEIAVHPLDHVGVDVWCAHLHRCGQVDDHGALVGRVEHVDHFVADPLREGQLGAGERFGAVLVVNLGVGGRLEVTAQLSALERDVDDAVLVESEYHLALQRGGGVIDVDDRLFGAVDGFEGATDETLATLCEHLDGHVVGDLALFDDLSNEVEVGL